MPNGNVTNGTGTNRILWWIVGLMAPALVGLGTSAYHATQSNSERIAILESELRRIEENFRHIDQKLDRLIEHGNLRNR